MNTKNIIILKIEMEKKEEGELLEKISFVRIC